MPRPAHSFNDYYTFVRADFSPKQIYLDVQQYALAGEEVDMILPSYNYKDLPMPDLHMAEMS